MAMKRCPVCGERYSDTYKNCPFCEEEEYWEEEQEPARRPILREGVRSPGGRGGRSAYGIVTPILIVLIVLMALLLVYLLYRSDTSHTVSAAETFYSIFFQSHSLRDGGISIALRPKGENLSFLFGGHKSAPPSGYAEKEGVLSGFWYKK